jgi:hypothetical protein
MSSRKRCDSDPLDHYAGRWLKRGLEGMAPPEGARRRLLAAAAAGRKIRRPFLSAAPRRRAAVGIAMPPDDWSMGLARQAVLRWFPAMVISVRIGH